MVHNSYYHINTGATILFDQKKAGQKGHFKAQNGPKIGHFGPKHLQKSSHGFEMIIYGLQ